MSLRKLRDKYGDGKPRQVINRAIRAEMVGGDNLLDAMELVARLADRLKDRDLAGTDEAFEALAALARLRELMADLLMERYRD